MPLTVLSDSNVRDLLQSLSLADVEALQNSLRDALHEYSTGTQNDACASQQPERTSHQSSHGLTTLFMPSTSSSGISMKVVTLAAPPESGSSKTQENVTPRGALTILSHDGRPTGFLNAEEVTAFRTALASSLFLSRRSHLKTLTVFGAGKQAFWHVRLALLLRGHAIKQINIINRTLSSRTKNLLRSFIDIDHEIKTHEGWSKAKFAVMSQEYGEYARLLKEQLRAADAIVMTVPSTKPLFDHTILTSTEGRRKGRLLVAVGSYKPHMIEIPVEVLHQAVAPTHDHRHFHRHAPQGGVIVVDTLTGCLREAGEVIQAALSPMQLVELGELVMLEGQIAPSESPSRTPSDLSLEKMTLDLASVSPQSSSSMASVLQRDGGRKSSSRSGSLSRALSGKSRSERHRRSSSVDSAKTNKDDAMSRWLSDGNVIYKSVGMGLMDLVVGGDLVRLARQKGIGTTIQEF